MKKDCCENCRFYWEPDCHRFSDPVIRVYRPKETICQEYEREEKEDKK